MTTVPAHSITGATARDIARSIEDAISSGTLAPGAALPSVRALATDLGVSPTTVSTAYRDLRTRGMVVTHDRSRTVVSHRPPVTTRPDVPLPPGVRDVGAGGPDPALLPDLAATLRSLDVPVRLYGEEGVLPALRQRGRAWLDRDGIEAADVTVVSGALDGIERVLGTALRVGDRVAVEDPGYTGVLDLVRALGLEPVPIEIDDDGPVPGALAAVVDRCAALLLTPRGQNPSGAALTHARAEELVEVIAEVPDLFVIEDDHAGDVAGGPAYTLTRGRRRWAVVRSLNKSLGPDLRVAVLAGDPRTVAHVEGRLRVGPGWVSHVLQRLAVALWETAEADGTLARATAVYAERRDALVRELADHGIAAHGRTGLNVWIPVPEESPLVHGLLQRGWAVQAGERYRLASPPAIRVTTASLEPADAAALAADIAALRSPGTRTRRG